jgi:peptide/nickel transport system substrate-binding protein
MAGQWESMALGMSGEHEPHGSSAVLRTTGHLHFWHPSAATGDAFPYEVEIDRLLDLAAGTYDTDLAFQYYKRVQLLFAQEDLGMIFSVNPRIVIAVYNDVGNGTAIKGKGTPHGSVSDLLFFNDDGIASWESRSCALVG